ncbi:SusC/RagA family TonB-linked outer membrane protein [Phocaeicola vulgatus]|uniref:SusC/RagA family TonB-linked outer membrane protein n=1 Tax=Phocaeicola vulgatus TaxID=821 RepID=A0A848QTY3_PHOVU|nr:SusC/RagA family TonB-linked outer membrane protein [Phocaeicola vulgatus]NMW40023.1 SusC/RagA family TonB-linked outer membrane protein [Phocaeicola vulgatus]
MRQKDRFLLLLVLASLPIGRMAAEELESTSPSPIRQEIRQSSVRITGTVVDVQGEPIIGASVVEKGTSNNGVITDVDGNFVLNVSPGSTLQISYVGYGTQEIVIGSQRSFNIVMKEDTELLDEVVVMAYNTTVKRKLTNAVTTVDTEQISDLAAYSSVSQAIQGRAPGVYISNSTGMPGSTPSLKIRGNDAPLYVIDGIVQDAETFNRLNSQDIESISIMKDAASAAVYGAVAGNGVVVVKTKSGKIGKTRINYTFDQQINQPTNRKENISSYELATTANEINRMFGSPEPYDQTALDAYRTGSDPINYPNLDWWDIVMRKVATAQRHSLTIDGGSEATQYHMSLGYYNQGTLAKPVNGQDVFNYKQYNVGINVNHTFENIGLKVGFDFKGSLNTSKGKNEGNIAGTAKTLANVRLYNAEGKYYANTPYLSVDPATGYTQKKKPIANVRLNLDWDVIGVKGLKATFVGNYRSRNSSEKQWNKAYVPSYYDDGTQFEATSDPSLMMRKDDGWRYELNVGLRYNTTIAQKHTLDIGAYYNQLEEYSEWISATRQNYLSSSVDQIFAGPTSSMSNDGGASEKGRLGFIGVLNYDFMGRYLLTANFRYDGSDNYAKGNRWGFFPSVSAGWVISDEKFMQNINDAIKMDLFKIRASWGKTGIDGERFAYYANWSMGSVNFDVNGNRAPGVTIPGLISPDLSWYFTRSFNVGFDYAFLNNRLSGSVDYFVQNTEGYLINPTDIYKTPLGTDLPKIMSNDKYRRAGAEFMVRWRDTAGKLNYEVGANLSFYDKLWVRKTQDLTVAANPLTNKVGKTISDGTRTWITDGLYQTADDLLDNPHASWTSNLVTGDIKYVDVNGDGRIDTNATYSGDKVFNHRKSEPLMQYGIDFLLEYDGFFLSGLIQGAGSNWKFIGQNAMPMGVDRLRYSKELDYWTPTNTDARFPLLDPGTGRANNITVKEM